MCFEHAKDFHGLQDELVNWCMAQRAIVAEWFENCRISSSMDQKDGDMLCAVDTD